MTLGSTTEPANAVWQFFRFERFVRSDYFHVTDFRFVGLGGITIVPRTLGRRMKVKIRLRINAQRREYGKVLSFQQLSSSSSTLGASNAPECISARDFQRRE